MPLASKVFLIRRLISRPTRHCLIGWVLIRHLMITAESANWSTPNISSGSRIPLESSEAASDPPPPAEQKTTSCFNCERTFSALKLIKTYLQWYYRSNQHAHVQSTLKHLLTSLMFDIAIGIALSHLTFWCMWYQTSALYFLYGFLFPYACN